MAKTKKAKLNWLVQKSDSEKGKYRHRRFDETAASRLSTISELQILIDEAHSDAITKFESFSKLSLDPLKQKKSNSIKIKYPSGLDIENLKGYFGEILAAHLILEKSPFKKGDWIIPAFRFRFHNVAFERLISSAQLKVKAKKIPGLTGEDCVAVRINETGKILEFLVCEAKCTKGHSATIVADAHEQVSSFIVPAVIPQLVEILRGQKGIKANNLADALCEMLLNYDKYRSKRCNFISYVCGNRPLQKDTWIDPKNSHKKYKSKEKIEVAEVHLDDVDELVAQSYRKK